MFCAYIWENFALDDEELKMLDNFPWHWDTIFKSMDCLRMQDQFLPMLHKFLYDTKCLSFLKMHPDVKYVYFLLFLIAGFCYERDFFTHSFTNRPTMCLVL